MLHRDLNSVNSKKNKAPSFPLPSSPSKDRLPGSRPVPTRKKQAGPASHSGSAVWLYIQENGL